MRKSAVLNIAVQNKYKTSSREAGMFDLHLDDGEKIVAMGHMYYPDHDRSLFEGIVMPFLRWYKPRVIVILGGAIHDDAFQSLAPRALRRMAMREHDLAPEVAAAKAVSEIFEARVRNFGATCGDFLSSLADAAGDKSTVIYLPSSSPRLPCENEIISFLTYTKQRIDAWRENHPAEHADDLYIPCLPVGDSSCSSGEPESDFAELIGLTGNEKVRVLPFGSSLILNRQVTDGQVIQSGIRFEVGSTRLKNPLSAGFRAMFENRMPTVRGFDGKMGNGWMTQVKHSLLAPRNHTFFSEVPNLMDSERMGYLGDDQRWAKGLYVGNICQGQLHGRSYAIQRGVDGRRGVVVCGRPFDELEPSGYGRQGRIEVR